MAGRSAVNLNQKDRIFVGDTFATVLAVFVPEDEAIRRNRVVDVLYGHVDFRIRLLHQRRYGRRNDRRKKVHPAILGITKETIIWNIKRSLGKTKKRLHLPFVG